MQKYFLTLFLAIVCCITAFAGSDIKVMGFIPGNATKVWGTMTVKNLSTGEVIAVIEVTEVNGGANPSPDGSFSDCFEELAKQVSKLK